MTRRSRLATVLAPLVLALAGPSTFADSWELPKTRKVRSANGRYTALVIPRDVGGVGGGDRDSAGRALPRVHVYEGEPGAGGKWNTLWAVALSNDTAPVTVILTDDARHLVTLDEWHSVGRGKDTVAFYARDGAGGRQLARYALEQILTPDEQRHLPMSVSSTWWREHGHTFLDETADGRRFLCVWLGTCGRRLAWDVATGGLVNEKPDGEAARRWDARTRAWAVQQLAAPNRDVTGGLRYLATTKDPRDRAPIEAQLAATEFRISRGTTDGEPKLDLVTAESPARQQADRALAVRDGQPFLAAMDDWPWRYVRLGTLEASVRLDPPPPAVKGRGGLFVYLVPEAVAEAAWAGSRPVHRIRIGVPDDAPAAVPQVLAVRFEGVTPGRYWVKAVYDRAEPYCDGDRNGPDACTPDEGDYQSFGLRVVEVKAGGRTQAGQVACTAAAMAAAE